MEFTNSKGQIVGKLYPDNIFRKVVSRKKHFLLNHQGWAIDEDIFRKLKATECIEIRIKDEDEGKVYSIKPLDFEFYGEEIDYGYGKQLVVNENKFNVKNI